MSIRSLGRRGARRARRRTRTRPAGGVGLEEGGAEMTRLDRDEPRIIGAVPGPRSAAWLERDHRVMSPSYTRVYPLVVRRARGAMIEDMDGNRFLDFTAGIAVTNV